MVAGGGIESERRVLLRCQMAAAATASYEGSSTTNGGFGAVIELRQDTTQQRQHHDNPRGRSSSSSSSVSAFVAWFALGFAAIMGAAAAAVVVVRGGAGGPGAGLGASLSLSSLGGAAARNHGLGAGGGIRVIPRPERPSWGGVRPAEGPFAGADGGKGKGENGKNRNGKQQEERRALMIRQGPWKPRVPQGGVTNLPMVGQALLGAGQVAGAGAGMATSPGKKTVGGVASGHHRQPSDEVKEGEEVKEESDPDPEKRQRVDARHRLNQVSRQLGLRRHNKEYYEVANLGQAKGMPPIVYINVPECDGNGAVASVVRRAAMRHGLRGANTGVDSTLEAVRREPVGTPAVVADGLSMHELQSLQSGGQLAAYPYTFTLLDHPLDRAVAAFVHHGMSQSGWKGSKKNLKAFLLGPGRANAGGNAGGGGGNGKGGRGNGKQPGTDAFSLGAVYNFHRANFLTRRVAGTDEIAKVEAGTPLTDQDVDRVLDRYNLVGTREKLNETLVFLKLSVPTLELRDVVQVPPTAYQASDPFGFATADHMGREAALDPDAREWIRSEEFTRAFEQLNAADYALYAAAQRRLEDRVRGAGRTYGRHVWWMNALNKWLETRLAAEPAFATASAMPRATSSATPCPEGHEAECARRILRPGVGNQALAAQAKKHAGEECLFLNQGCFAQLVIDVTLAEFKRNAARKIEGKISPVSSATGSLGQGEMGPGGPGEENQAARVMSGELDEESLAGHPTTPYATLTKLVQNMGLCSKQAVMKDFKTCEDATTFGWGLSGKRIVAGTQQVYILCHNEECDSVCVPKMWAKITTVLDGGKTDKCFGFDRPEGSLDHWHKASLMHASAIEHAREAGYAPVAIIESDAVFVEAESVEVAASAGAKLGMDSFLRETGRLGTAPDVISGVAEDLANFGDFASGDNGFSGKETTMLKAMLGSTRWSEEDERAMLELVASGTYEATKYAAGGGGEGLGAEADGGDGGGGGVSGSSSDAGRWTLIRLGYRPMDFENGEQSCPAHCGCWHRRGARRWCTVHTYSCDMRAAHAYIVSAQAYPLMLAEILGTPGYGVIDAGTFQRIPQQVFTTPMLAVQKHAQADLITPAEQLKHAQFFGKACATGSTLEGRGDGSAAAAAADAYVGGDDDDMELMTRHAHHELAQYLPTEQVGTGANAGAGA